MSRVPREMFVPEDLRGFALHNVALSIGEGQTISQPFVVALMTQALSLDGSEHVLEIGTGSGYQCAVLAELCQSVVSVERIPALSARAGAILSSLGYWNVELVIDDGTLGCPASAPYDAIIVTAAAPHLPLALVDQLAARGRLVLPLGSTSSQELILHTRTGSGLEVRRLGAVRFVPLIGREGWDEEQAEAFNSDLI